MAATEDGEEEDAAALQGLHAKAFIAERGWDTAITVGSGNATRPALLTGSNVEIFTTLTGKRSRVGSVEEILGDKGFGRLTRPFVRDETGAADAAQRAAEARLDQARREICQSGITLRCERAEPNTDGAPDWRVWLAPSKPLSLAGIGVLQVWPITRGEGHARDVLGPLRQGQPVNLGAMQLVDLTRFLACHLADARENVSILFSTGLMIEGLPAERHAAILRWVIDSKDAFFRYLRLLLSELGDPFAAAALAAQNESGQGTWRAADDDAPILEEMVRVFCRGGDQLRAIERLIAIQAARPTMLDQNVIDAYGALEPANGRMRAILKDVFGQHLEQNLWIPAAMPYYGEKRSGAPLTKALIFSSWSMVPDAIAALLSYEAERRMGVGESGRRYFEQDRLRPLQFRLVQGRLAGLRTLLLIYPSPALAELADPLAVFSDTDITLSQEGMRDAIRGRLKPALTALQQGATLRQDTNSTEWAVPAVIDELLGARSRAWLEAPWGMRALASEDAFQDHVAELARAVKTRDVGASPADLSDLLIDVALGSPAICALRALKRVAPELPWDDPRLLSAASEVAWSFRALFNQHESVALLRRDADDHYWRRVLVYCAEHNLQAVLDEYAHYLVDAEGLGASPAEERAIGVARAIAQALAIRPSQIEVDDVHVAGEAISISKFQMRGRFAMRLADYKDEDGAVARLGSVRDAFNSPFRPFALATRSIGQEGLDFHPYCYRVYHWNLPSNPVDLEQREGRVHRFKGHAVRLNLAERQATVVRGRGRTHEDPWQLMFERARSEAAVDTDIIPYWIYEGSAQIERRVLMLPFSWEVTRLAWLKRSLTVYRLAFGQPRQDDLLNYLQTLAGGTDANHLADLQIRLEPDVFNVT